MTVRVVGKATTQRVTCPDCLSILEFEPGDRYYVNHTGDPGSGRTTALINCPTCRQQLNLNNLEVTGV